MDHHKREQLGVIGVSFEEAVEADTRRNVEAHFESSETLEQLIFGWIDDKRSVYVCSAIADAGEEDGFFVYLRVEGKNVASIIILLAWLRAQYPGLLPATETGPDSDDEKIEDKVWCAIVADYAFGKKENLKTMASYLFANSSEIYFETAPGWVFQENTPEELEILEGRRLYSINPHYMNSETGEGFGENRWGL